MTEIAPARDARAKPGKFIHYYKHTFIARLFGHEATTISATQHQTTTITCGNDAFGKRKHWDAGDVAVLVWLTWKNYGSLSKYLHRSVLFRFSSEMSRLQVWCSLLTVGPALRHNIWHGYFYLCVVHLRLVCESWVWGSELGLKLRLDEL